MTSAWMDILWHYDIYGSKGCLQQSSNCLLVEPLEESDGHLKVMVFEPEGCSTQSAIYDFMTYNHDTPLQEMSLLWDVRMQKPCGKSFILNALEAPLGETSDFTVNLNSLVLPVEHSSSGAVRVLELFAGGFGGWRQALEVMNMFAEIPFHTCAVEWDVQAAFCYAAANKALLVDGYHKLPHDLLTATSHDLVIHGDVTSENWLEAVARWGPEIIAVSSPCTAWSSASKGPGLNSFEGQLLPESLGIVKLIRPRLVLLEQVALLALSHIATKNMS